MSNINDDDLTRMLAEAAAGYPVPEHGADEVRAALADRPSSPIARRPWFQLSSAAAAASVIVAGAVFFAVNDGNPTVASNSAPSRGTQLAGGGASSGGTTGGSGLQSGSFDSQVGSGTAAFAPAATGVAGSVALGSAPAPAAPAPAALPQVGAAAADEGASRVVKSGALALVVKDGAVSDTLKAVERAARVDGGYIASGTTNEYGETPSGELSIRVPVAKFENLVAQIRGLNAKVRTATTTGKDVTAQYSDLESQLRTLRATRERFLLILARTKTISEILTVQQRVDGVSGQIDRLEGQRKLLASQSDLATLTVSVSEEGDPVVKATNEPRSGLSQALINAKDGFVSGVEAIVSHSGRALLWILSIAVVALFLRSGLRVARRRMV